MNKHERCFETKGSCCPLDQLFAAPQQSRPSFSHWCFSDHNFFPSILTFFHRRKTLKKKHHAVVGAAVSEVPGFDHESHVCRFSFCLLKSTLSRSSQLVKVKSLGLFLVPLALHVCGKQSECSSEVRQYSEWSVRGFQRPDWDSKWTVRNRGLSFSYWPEYHYALIYTHHKRNVYKDPRLCFAWLNVCSTQRVITHQFVFTA